MGLTNSRDQTIEKMDPPSGSPAGSPVMMRVVREEIPLSRREGEEVMRRRLGGESRSPSPPPFEPPSSTAKPRPKPPVRRPPYSVSLLDMDMYLLLSNIIRFAIVNFFGTKRPAVVSGFNFLHGCDINVYVCPHLINNYHKFLL